MDGPSRPITDTVPRLGSMFGRYRIESILGQGGMGVVFRATDVRLDRTVALKVLAEVLADDPGFRRRFERESRLAASIEHPAILPIYDADAIGSTLYIVMRLVPGGDLATAIRREAPLTITRTLAIADRIAGALDAAHDPRSGGSGHVAGSIATMAPEIIQGTGITPAADQYSLACVVYECLTGASPFDGDSDAARLFRFCGRPWTRSTHDGMIACSRAGGCAVRYAVGVRPYRRRVSR